MGKVFFYGGFADVSDGEYSGRPMAIKRLRMNEGDSDRTLKVSFLNLYITFAQLSPSVYVERLSVGSICPTGISYLYSAFPRPRIHTVSASSQSGCPMGM